jgi:hypothetical protein
MPTNAVLTSAGNWSMRSRFHGSSLPKLPRPDAQVGRAAKLSNSAATILWSSLLGFATSAPRFPNRETHDRRLPEACPQSVAIQTAKLAPTLTVKMRVTGTPPTGAASPDIGRATATMRFGIADAPPATTKEIACRWVGRRDGRLRDGGPRHQHPREHRLGLIGPGRPARGPTRRDESHNQHQKTEAAHRNPRKRTKLSEGNC